MVESKCEVGAVHVRVIFGYAYDNSLIVIGLGLGRVECNQSARGPTLQ